MRAFIPTLLLLSGVGCGQEIDHPTAAPPCDPKVMRCSMNPHQSDGSDGSDGGADSGGDTVAAFSGRVVAFIDDFFDQTSGLNVTAEVSADGRSGSRVTASYDGASFQLDSVLKTKVNWLGAVPATNSGFLPTLTPVDTLSVKADALLVPVASALDIEGILQNLGTALADARAQIVVHVVDAQNRSVAGVTAELSGAVVAYRTAGAWLGGTAGTDDSGLIFLGNAPVGSALTSARISLSGAATARVDVEIAANATTVVTAVVAPK